MITIRRYRESDAENVGKLIADTYSEFNLSYFDNVRFPPHDHVVGAIGYGSNGHG